MSIAIVTGSAGLIGSESTKRLHAGRHATWSGSTTTCGADSSARRLRPRRAGSGWRHLFRRYRHHDVDIRDTARPSSRSSSRSARSIGLIVHTAAQPSHDWAAREPHTDFDVNAVGTLNVLEAARQHCPEAAFIFTSTNKVYGDTPNRLPLVELETRFEIDAEPPIRRGIARRCRSTRPSTSLFGARKVAADVLVQEYGRYFGMRTACFRGGMPDRPGARRHASCTASSPT